MKWKWWERLLLKFRPYYIGIDPAIGEEDYTVKVYMKYLFGNYHIIKIERVKGNKIMDNDMENKIKELEKEIGMFKRSADIRLNKIESLEAKIKQNDFEIIASGEAAKDLFLKGLYFMNDINTNNKFKKYDDSNIQIGVREVK